jgi:carbon-monoxide dehydrogenase medium subunit
MFLGPFTSALEDTELLTAVEFPSDVAGYGVREFAMRQGDFATVVVAVAIRSDREGAVAVRVAAGGIDVRAIRIPEGEAVLRDALRERPVRRGAAVDSLARSAGAACSSAVRPLADNHASSAYRRHLVGELVAQAAADAMMMVGDGSV